MVHPRFMCQQPCSVIAAECFQPLCERVNISVFKEVFVHG